MDTEERCWEAPSWTDRGRQTVPGPYEWAKSSVLGEAKLLCIWRRRNKNKGQMSSAGGHSPPVPLLLLYIMKKKILGEDQLHSKCSQLYCPLSQEKTYIPFLHCLFVTCTEGIFFLFILDPHITYYNITCNIMIYLSKKRPLNWNGGSSYLVKNHHPCCCLARSQLPILRSLPVPNIRSLFPLFPPKATLYIHTTFTCLYVFCQAQ